MLINQVNTQSRLVDYIKTYKEKYDKVFLLTQKSIIQHYPLIQNLDINILICQEQELCKSIKEYEDVIKKLSNNNCNKKSLIIGMGGGAITDLSGFVASSYMRGIKHVLIPTTLLGMVDASIGGKTALNVNNFRNLIGSFKTPIEVLLYYDFLQTLNSEEIYNGYSEIIKYALIVDYKLFELLEKNISSLLQSLSLPKIKPIISKCIKHKLNIVKKDQYDNDIRMILNFGHTVGHALESFYNYNLSHGQAVLYGMKIASYLSYKEHTLGKNQYDRIVNLINKFQLPKLEKLDRKKIQELINNDKKNIHNQLNYIVLKNIGEATIKKNFSKKKIINALKVL